MRRAICTDIVAPSAAADRRRGRVKFVLYDPARPALEVVENDGLWRRIPSSPREGWSDEAAAWWAEKIRADVRREFGENTPVQVIERRVGPFGRETLAEPLEYRVFAVEQPYLPKKRLEAILPAWFALTHPFCRADQQLRMQFGIPWNYVALDGDGRVHPTGEPVPLDIFINAKMAAIDIETKGWQWQDLLPRLAGFDAAELREFYRGACRLYREPAEERTLNRYAKEYLLSRLHRLVNAHKDEQITTVAFVTESGFGNHVLSVYQGDGTLATDIGLGPLEARLTPVRDQADLGVKLTELFEAYSAAPGGPILWVAGHYLTNFDLEKLAHLTPFRAGAGKTAPFYDASIGGFLTRRRLRGMFLGEGAMAQYFLDTANNKLPTVTRELLGRAVGKRLAHAELPGQVERCEAGDRGAINTYHLYCLEDTGSSFYNAKAFMPELVHVAAKNRVLPDVMDTTSIHTNALNRWNRNSQERLGCLLLPPRKDEDRRRRDAFNLGEATVGLLLQHAPEGWRARRGAYAAVRLYDLMPFFPGLRETLLNGDAARAVLARYDAATDPVKRHMLLKDLHGDCGYLVLRLSEVLDFRRGTPPPDPTEDVRYTAEFGQGVWTGERGLAGAHARAIHEHAAALWGRLSRAEVINLGSHNLAVLENPCLDAFEDWLAEAHGGFGRASGQCLSVAPGKYVAGFGGAWRGYGMNAHKDRANNFRFEEAAYRHFFKALFLSEEAFDARKRAALAALQSDIGRFWRGEVDPLDLTLVRQAKKKGAADYSIRAKLRHIPQMTQQGTGRHEQFTERYSKADMAAFLTGSPYSDEYRRLTGVKTLAPEGSLRRLLVALAPLSRRDASLYDRFLGQDTAPGDVDAVLGAYARHQRSAALRASQPSLFEP